MISIIFAIRTPSPTLRFSNSLNPQDADTGLPTPNHLLYALPFGDVLHIPLAGSISGYLTLVIGVMFEVRYRQQSRPVCRASCIVPLATVLFSFIEFLPLPRTREGVTIPNCYWQIAGLPGDFALMNIPYLGDGRDVLSNLRAETDHRRVALPFELCAGRALTAVRRPTVRQFWHS